MIIGRLLSTVSVQHTRLIKGLAIAGIVLGFVFFAVDFHDAQIEKDAAAAAAQTITTLKSNAPAAQGWFVGRWGFAFYAERSGLQQLLPDESKLQPGDWLAISNAPYQSEPLRRYLETFRLEPIKEIVLIDRWPLRTMLGYYNTGVPLDHREGPQRIVRIYRVERTLSEDGSGVKTSGE
jgi:hypothetical protein